MYIHEAINEAIKNNCYITRKLIKNSIKFDLNKIDGIELIMIDPDEKRHPKWQPTVEHLIADDWITTE